MQTVTVIHSACGSAKAMPRAVLASDLYLQTAASRRQEEKLRIPTGWAEVDKALDGGLRFGERGLYCLSGDGEAGVHEVSFGRA